MKPTRDPEIIVEKHHTVRAVLCGSRDWDKPEVIEMVVAGLCVSYGAGNVTVIEGHARGADLQARDAAIACGCRCEPHPADWAKHGKSAGPIRNREMLDAKADVVFAFKDNLHPLLATGGTEDCVKAALARGIPVYHIEKL